MANFFNTTFRVFDYNIFEAVHSLADSAGGFLTPLFKFITLIGEKGILFFAIALILMMFARTRKLGICMFGAVACGALITNVILKDMIGRVRPFLANEIYAEFWQAVGSPAEDGYSCPSGHVTAVMSAMTAMFILCNKKWSWTGFLAVLLMGMSRVYLIAHYPSDVLMGIVVGAVAGVVAWGVTKLIYYVLDRYKDNKFCAFVLNWDLAGAIKGLRTKQVGTTKNDQE